MAILFVQDSYTLTEEEDLFANAPEPAPMTEEDLLELWADLEADRAEYQLCGIPA